MAQFKIYGLRAHLDTKRSAISAAAHACAVETLGLPQEKRFQRFIALDDTNFIYPADRTTQYTIIEVSMFAGRSIETKKAFIRALFERLRHECAIAPQDVEITITETPRHNWGIRGVPGDELALNYKVDV